MLVYSAGDLPDLLYMVSFHTTSNIRTLKHKYGCEQTFSFFIMPHTIAFTFIRQDNFTNVPYNFTAQVMKTVSLSKIEQNIHFRFCWGAINFYYLSSIMSVKSRWSATPLTPLWKYQHSSLPAENSWHNLLINFHWTEVFLACSTWQ